MWAWPTTQLLKWVTRWTCGQRHHGALNADEKIHDGAGKNEFCADIRVNLSQFPLGRVPDVDQKHHDRNHHGHAVHDGDDLEPGGNRHLKQMMGADMGVDDQQRPETREGRGCGCKAGSRSGLGIT